MNPGGINREQATTFLAYLSHEKFIDKDGKRIVATGQRLTEKNLIRIGSRLKKSGYGRQGLGALVILWAGHHMRSDYARENFDFFEALRWQF